MLCTMNSRAQSQNVEHDQDYAMNALLNVNLSTQNLTNYEQQAVQKMQDLLDYITIIGSSKYNKTMRETALESVLGDFDKKARQKK